MLAALAGVLQFNDARAWADLLGLPKVVLKKNVRGGKKHRKRAEAETEKRCRNWLEGLRKEL